MTKFKQATLSVLVRVKVADYRVFSLIAVAERDGSESYRYLDQDTSNGGVPSSVRYETVFWDRDAAVAFFEARTNEEGDGNVLPHASIRGWSPDEVAECIGGLSRELQARLWSLVDTTRKKSFRETPEPEPNSGAWWGRLSVADRQAINAAVAADELYGRP